MPDQRDMDLYVGQQMDVYLKAAEQPKGLNLEGGTDADLPFAGKEAEPAEVPTKGAPVRSGPPRA